MERRVAILITLIWVVVFDLKAVYTKIGEYKSDNGRVVGIEKVDDRLFSIKYDGLMEIIDVSDPFFPVTISSTVTGDYYGGQNCDIKYYNDRIYLGGGNGLHLYDASDVFNPEYIATVGTDVVSEIEVYSDIVYLLTYGTLKIIDISRLRDPVILQTSSGNYNGICLDYPYLYAVSGTGLKIFDVSDPSSVTVSGSLSLTLNNTAGDIAVEGDFAYISSYGFYSIDISDPSSPILLSSLSYYRNGVIALKSGKAVIDDGSFMTVIDISDPQNISETGYYTTPGTCEALCLDDFICYIADGYCGVHIIDISDPHNQYMAGSLSTFRSSSDIKISGDYLFIADGYDLKVVDISDPYNFIMKDGFFNKTGEADNISLFGNDLCVGYSYQVPDMILVDVSDPLLPTMIYDFDYSGPSYVYSMLSFQTESNIFVVNEKTFEMYLKTEGGNPVLVSSLDCGDEIRDIIVHEGRAYVSLWNNGIYVLDFLGDSIIHTGSITGITGYCKMAADETFLYISDQKNGIKIFDISDPDNPEEKIILKPYENMLVYSRPLIFNDQLFVFDYQWNRILIFDIYIPENAYLLNSIPLDRQIREMVWKNGMLYSANLSSGVSAMDLSSYVSIDNSGENLIKNFELTSFPNPFNPVAAIEISINKGSRIELMIYDISGKFLEKIFDKRLSPGFFKIDFNAEKYQSGTYICSIKSDGTIVASKKLTLLK